MHIALGYISGGLCAAVPCTQEKKQVRVPGLFAGKLAKSPPGISCEQFAVRSSGVDKQRELASWAPWNPNLALSFCMLLPVNTADIHKNQEPSPSPGLQEAHCTESLIKQRLAHLTL